MGFERLSPIYTPSVMRPQPNPMWAGAIGGRVLYVRQQGAPEEFPEAFGTMTAALAQARDGDTIVLLSNLLENVTASNLLFDITIIGNATVPRHDDSNNLTSNFHMGNAEWATAAGVTTTPLLTVRAQGWRFVNILFAPPSSSSAVKLHTNTLSGESEFTASHASFYNCRFDAGSIGIEDSGGTMNVRVERCVFRGLTDTGIKSTSLAVARPYLWQIVDNVFMDNGNHIKISGNQCVIRGNTFGKFTTTAVKLSEINPGDNNIVWGNYFSGDYDAKYVGNSTDEWAGNYTMDTTSAEVGDNGITKAVAVP